MTNTDVSPTPTRRTAGWRAALVASGILLVMGGRMHPSADADGSLREELATMTADDAWVPAHAFVVVSTALLAVAFWVGRRAPGWPRRVRTMLTVAAAALSAYALETVFHLASVVDKDELHAGHAAPVAFTHVGLSVVLYPLAGLAIAALAWSLGRTWGAWRWLVAGLGIAGGLAHASSVPLTIAFPDTELSPVFAGAAISIAVWSIGFGLVGVGRPEGRSTGSQPPATDARRQLAEVGA